MLNTQVKNELKKNREELVQTSALTRALDIFSDVWGFLILRDLFRDVNRFGDFLISLSIPRQTLMNRLEMLADHKIIYKRPIRNGRVMFEYKLTPMGRDLYRYAISIWQWYIRWMPGDTILDPALTHARCGQPLELVMQCQSCHNTVEMDNVLFETGPGAGEDPAPAARKGRRNWNIGSKDRGKVTLSILCDRWNNMIMSAIFVGVANFDAIQKHIGVAPNILSQRLKSLTDLGLIVPGDKNRQRRLVPYEPTQKGKDYFPCLFELSSWGNRWLMGWNGPATIPIHTKCSNILESEIVCAHCNTVIRPHEVLPGKPRDSDVRGIGEHGTDKKIPNV